MNTRETKEISQAWDKVAPGDDDFVTPTDVVARAPRRFAAPASAQVS